MKKTLAIKEYFCYNIPMHYLKQTLQYLFVYGKGKRFLILFLVCLVPAAMISYCVSFGDALQNLLVPPAYSSWGEVWLSYFNVGWAFLSLLIGLLACILASACIVGAAIKHFRIGVFTLQQLGASFNDYFLPSVWHVLLHVVLFVLLYTLYTLFAYVYYVYLAPVAYSVLCFVTVILFAAAAVYLISSLTLWYPGMCIKGNYSVSFLLNAFYRSRAKQLRFLPGHVLCFVILILTSVASYFAREMWYVSWIVGSVGLSACFALSLVYGTVVYFGENCLPREDLARRYL